MKYQNGIISANVASTLFYTQFQAQFPKHPFQYYSSSSRSSSPSLGRASNFSKLPALLFGNFGQFCEMRKWQSLAHFEQGWQL